MTIRTLATALASRARTEPITTAVLHSTAGGLLSGSIAWLRLIGLSYHYMIDRDGTVYKCVPYSRVAFHAGKSVGPDGSDVNRYSIGICFAHRNDGKEQITDEQIQACRELLAELQAYIPSLEHLTTHHAITLEKSGKYRKSDPRGFFSMGFVAGKLKLWKPSYAVRYALP